MTKPDETETPIETQIDNLLDTSPLGIKIRRLYEAKRQASSRGIGSLTWLCRRAGMASKGYLGDVMSGRRRLHPRYAEPLAEALGLSGSLIEIFKTLVELEHANGEHATRLQARLMAFRRSPTADVAKL